MTLARRFNANGVKLDFESGFIAHCALPIDSQGEGLGKGLPASQLEMWNWQWAMLLY